MTANAQKATDAMTNAALTTLNLTAASRAFNANHQRAPAVIADAHARKGQDFRGASRSKGQAHQANAGAATVPSI
jgi:hypothetical protein